MITRVIACSWASDWLACSGAYGRMITRVITCSRVSYNPVILLHWPLLASDWLACSGAYGNHPNLIIGIIALNMFQSLWQGDNKDYNMFQSTCGLNGVSDFFRYKGVE